MHLNYARKGIRSLMLSAVRFVDRDRLRPTPGNYLNH